MIPRKGAEVAEITEKNLRDVLEVRCALEELAVQLACDRIDRGTGSGSFTRRPLISAIYWAATISLRSQRRTRLFTM